jgi:hypothetical protein
VRAKDNRGERLVFLISKKRESCSLSFADRGERERLKRQKKKNAAYLFFFCFFFFFLG